MNNRMEGVIAYYYSMRLKHAKIVIPGDPVQWARTRTSASGARFTPIEQRKYKERVQKIARPIFRSAWSGPVGINVVAAFRIPTSWPKWRRAAAEQRLIRPETYPDQDNILKMIMDSLNGIAYHDDRQCVMGKVDKIYGKEPQVEAELIFYPTLTYDLFRRFKKEVSGSPDNRPLIEIVKSVLEASDEV